MGTTANNIEVIILSDDEDEAPENDVLCDESSVYIVEPEDSGHTGNIWIYSSRPPVCVVLWLRCKRWPAFQTLL